MDQPTHTQPHRFQLYVAIGIIVVSACMLFLLFGHEDETLPIIQTTSNPVVDVIKVQSIQRQWPLQVRGMVEPEKKLTLLSQVIGTVTHISEKFVPGASFTKGDILLQIDTTYLDMEVQKANSAYSQALLHEQEIKAKMEAARLLPDAAKNELSHSKLQLDMASSTRKAAASALAVAKKQLENATVRAPFNGKVMARGIQEQEQVIAGRPLGQIYSTEHFILRLPLTQEQLAFIDIPDTHHTTGSHLVARNENTGEEWQGTIIHSEGFIGPNRLINVIAQLQAGKNSLDDIIPGSLLTADIQGRLIKNVIKIPASALLNDHQLLVVGKDSLVHTRLVDSIQKDAESAWVTKGITNGELIVVSPQSVINQKSPVNTHLINDNTVNNSAPQ